jgi:pentachlorophenol monooxygenase
MNTGIQDAHNLAWKLALVLSGRGSAGLLDSYDVERRPVGEEVVGRTVQAARAGIGADSDDPTYVVRREAQLLIAYPDSPIVGGRTDVTPAPGTRGPDAVGLTRFGVTQPFRLYSGIGRIRHTALVYAADGASAAQVADLEAAASAVVEMAHGEADAYVVASPSAETGQCLVPVFVDAAGGFAAAYHPPPGEVLVLRPDGYLAYRGDAADRDAASTCLKATFG